MKKQQKIIIAIAFLCLVILCSFTYSHKEGNKMTYATEQMQTLYYKEHSYICYRTYEDVRGGCGIGASIVHDPDCKCGKGCTK